MNGTDIALAAAVAGVGSEAAGITNYTPIGADSDDDTSGGSGPGGIPGIGPGVIGGGSDLSELAEALGNAVGPVAGRTGIDIPADIGESNPGEIADAVADAVASQTGTTGTLTEGSDDPIRDLRNWVDERRGNLRDLNPTSDDDSRSTSSSDGSRSTSSSDGSRPTLLQKYLGIQANPTLEAKEGASNIGDIGRGAVGFIESRGDDIKSDFTTEWNTPIIDAVRDKSDEIGMALNPAAAVAANSRGRDRDTRPFEKATGGAAQTARKAANAVADARDKATFGPSPEENLRDSGRQIADAITPSDDSGSDIDPGGSTGSQFEKPDRSPPSDPETESGRFSKPDRTPPSERDDDDDRLADEVSRQIERRKP
jgi:hypothetical protein